MAKFSLSEATELFQQSIGDRDEMFIYYYDKQLNEFHMIEQIYIQMIENDKPPDNLLDWMHNSLNQAKSYIEKVDQGDIVNLYNYMDVNLYTFIEQFVYYKNNDDLAYVIRGKKAFRRFRDTVERKGWLEEWYEFERVQYAKKVIEWAEENNLDYDDDLTSTMKIESLNKKTV